MYTSNAGCGCARILRDTSGPQYRKKNLKSNANDNCLGDAIGNSRLLCLNWDYITHEMAVNIDVIVPILYCYTLQIMIESIKGR